MEIPAVEKLPVFIIRPTRGWVSLNLRELWEYRELLAIFVWRDIKVRYKQTAIGVGWVLIQPLLAMLVFTLFFGRLAKVPSEPGVPYSLFVYTALVLWQFFAKALTEASTSLVVNERLISKVYFPRLLVPTGVVLSGLLDCAIASLLLGGMIVWYGVAPTWTLLVAPGFLLMAVFAALGVSYWLSALDVEYRDVRYTLHFLTQVWLFASPVVYPSSLVPEAWRALYGLNPMVGIIEGFRWSLLGTTHPPDPRMLAVSGAAIALLFFGGLVYFRRMERTLADKV